MPQIVVMVIHWGKPVPGWLLFGVLILICLFWFFYPPGRHSASAFETESIYGTPHESPLNDSLPHYRYRQIEDSLKYAKSQNDFFTGNSGGGWQFGVGGTGIASYDFPQGKSYLLSVEGYRLKEWVSVDNLKNGTVVSYPVWDKIEGNSRSGHKETRQTRIKYREGQKDLEGVIYFPVAKITGNILWFLLLGLVLISGLIGFYAVFYIPLRFLWQLSKGKAFTEENIGSLYVTGWVLVIYSLLMVAVKMIAHLVAAPQIPEGIEFSFYAAFMNATPSLLAGLAVLLLAKAFLQGLELKEEQDLTV